MLGPMILTHNQIRGLGAYLRTGGILAILYVPVNLLLGLHQHGVLVGYAAVIGMACAGALTKYRTERGLWMLCALFGSLIGVFLAFAVVESVLDLTLRHNAWSWVYTEGVVALSLYALAFWLLLSVGVRNWRMSRYGRGAGAH